MLSNEHWTDAYFGQPYSAADCGQLVFKVQRDVFKRHVSLPVSTRKGVYGAPLIKRLRNEYACLTYHPVEGDAVIMRARGRLWHVGIYFVFMGEKWVLHALKNADAVCRHKIRDLPSIGLEIDGYYKWL